MKAVVDTEIWVFAKKRPLKSKFRSEGEYTKFLKAHVVAQEFFREVFPKLKVYMTTHQLAEIFHVLSFRGARVPLSESIRLVKLIVEDPGIVKVPVTCEHVRLAAELSAKTGIHIWDFLCILPVAGLVDVVFSCDKHFLEIGRLLGIRVENPIPIWVST